mmetsp:Transcript_10083/g.14978  ORF Transcript_10083/g.14978 Transcript_10083/m.14978 type:complete len:127 (-) Transcript_10083:679-1059(-)
MSLLMFMLEYLRAMKRLCCNFSSLPSSLGYFSILTTPENRSVSHQSKRRNKLVAIITTNDPSKDVGKYFLLRGLFKLNAQNMLEQDDLLLCNSLLVRIGIHSEEMLELIWDYRRCVSTERKVRVSY